MNSIDVWRLKILLQNKNYRHMEVKASPLGGWFMVRKKTTGTNKKTVGKPDEGLHLIGRSTSSNNSNLHGF